MANKEKKKIELWEGYEVEVSEALFKDADFISDYDKAVAKNSFSEITTLTIALVSGERGENVEKVYNDIREHIIKEVGYFDIDKLSEILVKITDALPKVGDRAQGHSWKISK